MNILQNMLPRHRHRKKTASVMVSCLFLTALILILHPEESIAKTTASKKTSVNKKTTAKKSGKSVPAKKKPVEKTAPKQSPHSFYFCLSVVPFTVKNLGNTDITDYFDDNGDFQYVGNEGRTILNTDRLNQKTWLYGFSTGYKYAFKDFRFIGDLNFHTANTNYLYSVYSGFEYRFKTEPNYYLGFTPKIGYSFLFIGLHDTEMATASTSSTVIFKDGESKFEIKDGDGISLYSSSFSVQLLLTCGYILSNHVDLTAGAGFIYTKFDKTGYWSNFHFINGNSKQIVEHNSYIHMENTGKIETVGMTFNIGATYKL